MLQKTRGREEHRVKDPEISVKWLSQRKCLLMTGIHDTFSYIILHFPYTYLETPVILMVNASFQSDG